MGYYPTFDRKSTPFLAGKVCSIYFDEPDIPWENITAFLDAVRRYG